MLPQLVFVSSCQSVYSSLVCFIIVLVFFVNFVNDRLFGERMVLLFSILRSSFVWSGHVNSRFIQFRSMIQELRPEDRLPRPSIAIDRTDRNPRVVLCILVCLSWVSYDPCHIFSIHFAHEKLLFSVSGASDN